MNTFIITDTFCCDVSNITNITVFYDLLFIFSNFESKFSILIMLLKNNMCDILCLFTYHLYV